MTELSPVTAEWIAAVVASKPHIQTTPLPPDPLSRLAYGLLDPEEHAQVLVRLSEDEGLRREALAIFRSARQESSLDLAEGSLTHRQRLAEAMARWDTSVRAIGEALRLRPAAGWATNRGDADRADSVNAEIDQAGTFRAFSATPPGAEGDTLVLGLEDPAGGAVELGRTPVRGGAWELEIDRFEQRFGIGEETLSRATLRLQPPSGVSETHAGGLLYASIGNGHGPASYEQTLAFQLLQPLRIEAGALTVELRPTESLEPFQNHELQFFILGAGRLYRVGSMAVKGWNGGPKLISFAVPDLEAGTFNTGSILRLQLQPRAMGDS